MAKPARCPSAPVWSSQRPWPAKPPLGERSGCPPRREAVAHCPVAYKRPEAPSTAWGFWTLSSGGTLTRFEPLTRWLPNIAMRLRSARSAVSGRAVPTRIESPHVERFVAIGGLDEVTVGNEILDHAPGGAGSVEEFMDG